MYGKARFEVEQDRKLVFRFGSNDWGSVFLDGKKLFEYAEEEGRVAEPDQDSFVVNVKKGQHTVLIKCGDIGGAAWWYFFRITDAKGKAVQGVKWIETQATEPIVTDPAKVDRDKRIQQLQELRFGMFVCWSFSMATSTHWTWARITKANFASLTWPHCKSSAGTSVA